MTNRAIRSQRGPGRWWIALLLFILAASLVGAASADDYVGGIPLTTVTAGTVTGDLWMDLTPAPNWGAKDVTKTFTLPAAAVAAPGRIKWARLYISAYCAHMQSDYAFTMTTKFDGDGASGYEQTWPETAHEGFVYVVDGGNDNSEFAGHGAGEPYLMLNDHETRITSDYFATYDVTNLISSQAVTVNVNTVGSYDGRVKVMSLVVAYDDPASTTETRYWVNQGHDVCSYYTEQNFGTVALGTTTFATAGITGATSARLSIDYMASNNGYYGFPTAGNTFGVNGETGAVEGSWDHPLDRIPDVQGAYSGADSWDATAAVNAGSDVTFGYARYFPGTGTAAFYKLPLAVLVVKKPLPATAPVAAFSANDTTPDVGQTVIFTDASTHTPTSWSWTIEGTIGTDYQYINATSATSQNPHVKFLKAGTYDVSLTATNAGGSDTETKTSYITVTAPVAAPVAAFNGTPTNGTAPLTVAFTDGSTNAPTSWAWTFGDGSTSTERNPSHRYTAAGTYTVNLTATNGAGHDTETKTNYITVNPAVVVPVAAFSANDTTPDVGQTVVFTDASSNAPTSWSWTVEGTAGTDYEFVDATSATSQHPHVEFLKAGTYDVSLIATNAGGSDTETKTSYITVTAPVAVPVAAFTGSPTSGTAPLTVQFTDQSTNDPTSWAWEFGDGNTTNATVKNPVHTYTAAGNYTVNLTVTNDGGSDSEVRTGYVTVTGAPAAQVDLTIAGTVIMQPANAVFAHSGNYIRVNTIRNNGPAAAAGIVVALYASDVSTIEPVATTTIAALSSGGTNTSTLYDPTLRTAIGGTVTYTAVVDPNNLIAETDETNNNKASVATQIKYNGFKGKRYTDGSDLKTTAAYDGRYGLVYSAGTTVYSSSAGTKKFTFTSADLPIPAGATVVSARIYQACRYGNPGWTMLFNGNDIAGTQEAVYADRGYYTQDYDERAYVYNVTGLFNTSGNTLDVTQASTGGSMFGAYMVVVYSDPSATEKTIRINSEFDRLKSFTTSGLPTVTNDEASAWATFEDVDTSGVAGAKVIAISPMCDGSASFLFNNQQYPTLLSAGYLSGPQVAFTEYDVTGTLTAGNNTARLQSTLSGTTGDEFYATNAILIVEKSGSSSESPVANFTANVTAGAAPLTITFADASTNAPTSWLWDFGDGDSTNATVRNPVHTYTSAGTYNVTLTATNAGGSNSTTRADYITVTPGVSAPRAAFNGTPTNGTVPLTVQFTDESTGSPTSWLWDFGDGTSTNATVRNPVHTYAVVGTYNVTLTATNAAGNDSEVKTGYITVTPGSTAPTAAFTGTPTNGTVPLTVQFTDASTNAPTSWFWDFGDGDSTNATVQNPVHTYAAGGTYNVTLTATNTGGSNSTTNTNYITVIPGSSAPVAAFSGAPTSGTAPLTVTFTDASTNSPTSWSWDFGDGSTSSAQSPTHEYAKAGRYTVTLTVANAAGSDNETKYGYILVKGSSGGTTWDLYPTDPDNTLHTIMTSAVPGDTVLFHSGTYYDAKPGPMSYGDRFGNNGGITWRGEDRDTTVIEFGNEQFSFTGSQSAGGYTFENFTVHSSTSWGGVYGKDIVVRDCVFDGIAYVSIGRYMQNFTFDNNLVENVRNYAISLANYTTAYNATISNNRFVNASGSVGTGIILRGSGHRIYNNTFTGNGQLFTSSMQAGAQTIYLNTFQDFTTAINGTIYAESWVSPTTLTYTHNGNTYSHVLGNYWGSAYTGTDADNDGIGDTPHDTGGWGIDTAPLMEPAANYVILGSGPIAPIAAFTGTPINGTAPLTVQFTDESTGSPTSWLWDFGDGDSTNATVRNPVHIYAAVGTYNVTLTATNAAGNDSEVKTGYITVTPGSTAPTAAFTGTPTNGTVPLTVQFTDASTNSPTSWSWDFGDGNTTNNTVQHPVHTYTAAGNYTVNLTVTNVGGSDSEIKSGFITVTSSGTGGLAATAWPKFHANAENTGLSPYNGPQTGKILWTFSAGTSLNTYGGSPAIGSDGTLYEGSYNNNVYAVNPDGTQKWGYTTGGRITGSPAIGSDGTIYVGSSDYKLYALNPDGTPKWSYTTGGSILGSPAIGSDGTIYVGSNDKNLYAVNPDGSLKWTHTTGGSVMAYGGPAIGSDRTIYVGSNDRNLYAINPDGSLKWTYPLGNSVTSSPAIGSDGTIYVMDGNSYTLYAINPAGTIRWTRSGLGSGGDASYGSPAIGPDGTIYVGSNDYNLYAINPDGSPKWSYTTGSYVFSPPVVGADGTIYAGSYDYYLYALKSDGTLKWKASTGDKIYGSAAIGADGSLYISNLGGQVTAFGDRVPVASFITDKVIGNPPLTIRFTDTSTNLPSSWLWDFGDGASANSTEQNPTHTYAEAGTYTVKLTASNSVGSDEEIRTDLITVKTGSYTSTEKFSSDADAHIRWGSAYQDTNYGTASTLSTAVYSSSTGTWTRSLVHYDLSSIPAGSTIQSATLYGYRSVGTSTPAIDVFRVTGPWTETGVTWTTRPEVATARTGVATSPAETAWIGWDVTPDVLAYTNGSATNYGWMLTVTGDEIRPSTNLRCILNSRENTANSTYLQITYTTGNGTTAATAAFAGTPTNGSAPLTVQFTDESTGSPTSWLWDFGDGDSTNATVRNPVHIYAAVGTYNVTLTATNAAGNDSEVKTGYITVTPGSTAPTAAFTGTPTNGTVPLTVQFTDASTNSPTSWSWDFGDGNTTNNTVQHPVHTYTAAGNYTVNLTVTNVGGSDSEIKSGFITVTSSGTGGLAATAWPKFHANAENTGLSPYNGPQTSNNIWTYTTGSSINPLGGSPATGSDGTIYVGSYDHNLYALNPDGSLNWSFTTGERIYGSPAIGSDGIIYIGSLDYRLYALNPDGTLKWNYVTGGQIRGSPAIGSDGTIYVGSQDKKLYALNPDGTLKWSYTTGNWVQAYGGPAIGADGTIYAGSDDKNLYAIAPDGTLRWTYPTGGALESSPSIGSDGTIYVMGGHDKILYAINPDGTLKWTHTSVGTTGDPTSSSPAIAADGTIYVGSNDNKLYAFNADGTLKWSYTTGSYVFGPPVVAADGTIYVGSYDSTFYALNPDGTLKWSSATGDIICGSAAIGADGAVYIGNVDGKLYAFKDAAPVAAFSGTPTSGNAPLTVVFTDHSTNTPTSWSWDFGDGNTTNNTVQHPVHTYAAAGTYTVNLTAINGAGHDTETKTNYITVNPAVAAPVAAFSVNNTTPDVGQTVIFTDASIPTPTSWSWTIEGTAGTDYEYVDATSSTSQHPHVRFLKEGTYNVTLVAANSAGSDDEIKSDYIAVSSEPATIEITLGNSTAALSNMVTGQDGTGSATVNVAASNGAGWSVAASDGKTLNKGYMMNETTPLANPFELGRDGAAYRALTSDYTSFMSGTTMGSFSAAASLKQPVAAGDGAGTYGIVVTFTGAIS